MAATKVVAYIRIRRGSYEQWIAANPILKEGEGGLVSSGSQDIGKIKFGDGITSWNNLSYTIGADGIPATFEDPIIDIVSPGTPGSIVNEGSINEAKFHFYIPRGYPGITVPDITGLDEASSIDFDNDLMFVYSAADGIMRKWSPSIIKPLDYSTNEQETARKWIDGRPIYQKTISWNFNGSIQVGASYTIGTSLALTGRASIKIIDQAVYWSNGLLSGTLTGGTSIAIVNTSSIDMGVTTRPGQATIWYVDNA